MDRLRKQIAKSLAKARSDRGLSQTELARLVRVQPSAISHFELGRRMPNCNNLLRLASALGVSIDGLFGRSSLDSIWTPTAPAQRNAKERKGSQRSGK